MIYREALAPDGENIFPRLKLFKDYYLAGGTALALQIGHRQSIDFDLFSNESLKAGLIDEVEHVFKGQSIKPVVSTADEMTVYCNEVKLTFLHYPFPMIYPLINLNGQKTLGVVELLATKAYVIGRRGAFKDYYDLYYAFSTNIIALTELMTLAKRKYQEQFNERLFLEQLVYLKDIEQEPIQFLKTKVGKEEIERFFTNLISKDNPLK